MNTNIFNDNRPKTDEIDTNLFVNASKNTEYITKPKLLKQNILNSIPDDCVSEKNIELSKTKTEWRWQFYKIPELGKFVTISYKNNGQDRQFINHEGNYIKFDELIEFEQFIKKTLYHYC